MKNPKIKLLLLFSMLLSNLVFSQVKGFENKPVTKLPSKEKRFALIIGVDTYQKDISPLYGTVNDAKALRDVLIKYAGFADERIILMTTDSNDSDLIPTRGNIIDQLDKLQRVVPEDGLILFSFSGHGVSIGSDAFIVPADGRIYQSADLMRERAIDVLRIKRAIQDTKVKQVIMFLDACRNDPVRAKGDVDNNLTTAYAKGFSFETKNQNIEAYATLYATSFGDRAYEFLDKKTNKYRGYFSYAIEEGLKGAAANDKGEVTLAGLIRYIEDTVKERVHVNLNERQIPYPTTEGFRNSDLVIAVAQRNTPIINSTISSEVVSPSAIENSSEITNSIGMKFIKIPGKSFYMGKYEVTQAEWESIMQLNPSKFRNCPQCPVEKVSWYDVKAFIIRLNSKEGQEKYRLPFQEERDYVMRGGSETAFFWGDSASQADDYAWYESNSERTTHNVGMKKPNQYGLYDVAGNVWEWCEDGDDSSSKRVNRGGGWNYSSEGLNSSYRFNIDPSNRQPWIGFRLIRVK